MCLQQLFKIAFLCSPCKPLLLPSSSPFLRPSPLPNKQVRQLLFLLLRQLLLLQSRLKTKPLGRFQLLPDPPIPCNTSTLHNRIHPIPQNPINVVVCSPLPAFLLESSFWSEWESLQKRYLPGLPPPTCVLLYPYVPRRHAELDARWVWEGFKIKEPFPIISKSCQNSVKLYIHLTPPRKQ